MNREIKFRAWHKEKKQMIDGSLLFWFKAVAESGKGESVFNACEWLQFTGLKDKNGKEIYEGDIVKHNTKADGYKPEYSEKPQIIVWNKKLARFEFQNFWYSAGLIYNSYEIIGNIYENPELLEPPLGNNAEPIRNLPEDDRREDR